MDEDLLAAYDYDLPDGCIAQSPASRRDEARLLHLQPTGRAGHQRFHELCGLLRAGDLLVRNDTRVLPARLRGRRAGGGKAELLLVRPVHAGDEPGHQAWLCLARPAAHLKPGKSVEVGGGALSAVIRQRRGKGQVVAEFSWEPGQEFVDLLARYGQTPLPPYIERARGQGEAPEDRERYQTTYAARPGAVAAPTAGLHFTPALDRRLRERGVQIAHLTLHVGPGTFRPVKAQRLSEHEMDAECYHLPRETAAAVNAARSEGRRVVAVGTTSTRVLESVVGEDGRVRAGEGWTSLFIRPGFEFRVVDALVTNFHLPRSTLLVLVAVFAGRERVLAAYREAVERGYRFYSYGDAMLLEHERAGAASRSSPRSHA